jgi:hypothetical protein
MNKFIPNHIGESKNLQIFKNGLIFYNDYFL